MIESLTHFSSLNYSPVSVALAIFIFVAAVLLLLILAFEIWMFVDVIRNHNIPTNTKILWAVGMLLLHPFVAIVYFFVARSKKPPKSQPK
jgi:uncharacterized membrane protein (DUF485 family)